MAVVTTNLPELNAFHEDVQAYASNNGYGGLSTCGLYCRRGFGRDTLGVSIDRRRLESTPEVSLNLTAFGVELGVDSLTIVTTDTSVAITLAVSDLLERSSCEVLYDSDSRQHIVAGKPSVRHNRYHEPTSFYLDYRAKSLNQPGNIINDPYFGFTPFVGPITGYYSVDPGETTLTISAVLD